MTSGYSGKPLEQKLGLKTGQKAYIHKSPKKYSTFLNSVPDGLTWLKYDDDESADFIHFFANERIILEAEIPFLKNKLRKSGMLWISWPKKSSKLFIDITEDTLREILLPIGLVDIKVCAVNQDWSGLKFMWRKELR